MTKATKATVARRIEEVLRIRLDGAEFWDVREYAREKEQEPGSAWELPPDGKPLSEGQLWRYIGKADRMIAESCRASRKKLLRRHLAQRRRLFAGVVSQGDMRCALAVLADEAKLLGLYAPVKVAPTNPDGKKEYGQLTDEERAAALARLYAAMGAGGGATNPDESASADGSIPCGPGASADGCRNESGPVAGADTSGELDAGVAPLFETERQEPSSGGVGVG